MDFPAFLLLHKKIAFGEDAQVAGYRLAGDVEVLCNGVRGHGLHRDQDENRSSGWICNSLKDVASHSDKYEADQLRIYAKLIGFAKFSKNNSAKTFDNSPDRINFNSYT
jgi:hypothetical protein